MLLLDRCGGLDRSYERYVTAETALSMSQVRGNLGAVPHVRAGERLNDLRRAQAEAEVRCF